LLTVAIQLGMRFSLISEVLCRLVNKSTCARLTAVFNNNNNNNFNRLFVVVKQRSHNNR